MMEWLRSHTEGLIGWVVMLATIVFSLGHMSAELTGEIRHMGGDLAVASEGVKKNAAEISEVRTDVELLKDHATRSETLMDRQEQSIRSLDRLVVEVKTLVEARH